MKNAADWVAKAQLECFGSLSQFQDQEKIYLHNLFLQVQADAFQHAAGLVDESLRDVDVKGPGIHLRQHARAIWPGAPPQSECPPGAPPMGYREHGTDYVPETTPG